MPYFNGIKMHFTILENYSSSVKWKMIYLVVENWYRNCKKLVHGDSARRGIKRLNRGNTWRRRPLFTLPHTKYRYGLPKTCGTICCPKISPFLYRSLDYRFDGYLMKRSIFEEKHITRLIKRLSPLLDFTYFWKINMLKFRYLLR